jgi:hypothetical protein
MRLATCIAIGLSVRSAMVSARRRCQVGMARLRRVAIREAAEHGNQPRAVRPLDLLHDSHRALPERTGFGGSVPALEVEGHVDEGVHDLGRFWTVRAFQHGQPTPVKRLRFIRLALGVGRPR